MKEQFKNLINYNDVNWKWIIISLLILYCANFFSGFIISTSLKMAGLNDPLSFKKIFPFLKLVSITVPFILFTIITVFQKFNWKHVLYISIIFTVMGVVEHLVIGLKTFTLGGTVHSLIFNIIMFGLGKLFADLILKVYTKFFNKSN